MAITKRYDRANEERCGAAIEALDAAVKTISAEALAAASGKRTYSDSRHQGANHRRLWRYAERWCRWRKGWAGWTGVA